MTKVIRPSCWHQILGPNGLSAPAQGLYLNFFSSITADCNISSALRWAIQDQWSSGFFKYHLYKRRYKHIVLVHQKPYFVKDHSDCTTKLTETDIVNMLEFLLDNIFVVFDGQIFHRRLAFKWVLTVPHYLLICFCILMRRSSSKDFWSLARNNLPRVSVSHTGT